MNGQFIIASLWKIFDYPAKLFLGRSKSSDGIAVWGRVPFWIAGLCITPLVMVVALPFLVIASFFVKQEHDED